MVWQPWLRSREHPRDAASDPENIGDLSEHNVLNVLERVRAEFNIDVDRIYLMGHSTGGGGTWHLAIKYPEQWDAIAPVAPTSTPPRTRSPASPTFPSSC